MLRIRTLMLSGLLAAVLVPGLAVPASASKCTARKLAAAARYFDGVAKCEVSCALAHGTVGAPGTVCNAASGECAAPPSGEGPCRQDFIPVVRTETTCIASPAVTPGNGGSGGGTFVDDAVCLPSRLCIG